MPSPLVSTAAFSAPISTGDVLARASARWIALLSTFGELVHRYAYPAVRAETRAG